MSTRRARVRALWVTTSLGGGGAEMHLLRLLNAFNREHFACALAVARAGGSYQGMLSDDVPVFTLSKRTSSSTGSLALSIPPLRSLVRLLRPDVVCSILDHVNIATMISLAGIEQRPPLMLCVQITPRLAYQGPSLLSTAIRFSIRHLYHRSDRIVALSRGVGEELIDLDPRLSRITEVIPNAATDDLVTRSASHPDVRKGVAPHEHLIVACGRLARQKGFHVLLEALAIVRRSLPARLWLLGEGPERARLVQQADRLGLGDSVAFLGFQPDPSRIMAAADVFVLSSLFEGFANVVVEAMASGVPVVATDCPYGPAEIITHGKDGLLVPPGNREALAAALLQLLLDRATAQTMAAAARTRANDFHASQIACRYGRVMSELAAQKASLATLS